MYFSILCVCIHTYMYTCLCIHTIYIFKQHEWIFNILTLFYYNYSHFHLFFSIFITMETYFTNFNLYYTQRFCSLYFICHYFVDYFISTQSSQIFSHLHRNKFRQTEILLNGVKLPFIGQKQLRKQVLQYNFLNYSLAVEHADCFQILTSK